MKIYGKFKVWIDSYSRIVDLIGNYLFGWIHLYWINISNLEKHALVVCFLLSVGCMRGSHKKFDNVRLWRIERGENLEEMNRTYGVYNPIGSVISSIIFFVIFFLLPALLLPGWLGLLGMAICVFLVLFVFVFTDGLIGHQVGDYVKRELQHILVILIILIIINNIIFRWF